MKYADAMEERAQMQIQLEEALEQMAKLQAQHQQLQAEHQELQGHYGTLQQQCKLVSVLGRVQLRRWFAVNMRVQLGNLQVAYRVGN